MKSIKIYIKNFINNITLNDEYEKQIKDIHSPGHAEKHQVKFKNKSIWDTSNVSNMSNIFKGCTSLTSLDISGWNVK